MYCCCAAPCRSRAACQLYNSLVSRLASGTTNTTNPYRPPTGPLPWLYYQGNTYNFATDINLK